MLTVQTTSSIWGSDQLTLMQLCESDTIRSLIFMTMLAHTYGWLNDSKQRCWVFIQCTSANLDHQQSWTTCIPFPFWLQINIRKWHQGTVTYGHETLKKFINITEIWHKNSKPVIEVASKPIYNSMSPDLDVSDFLDTNSHQMYPQLIGMCSWLVVCGRIDINYVICSLNWFNLALKKGHVKDVKEIFCYLIGNQAL